MTHRTQDMLVPGHASKTHLGHLGHVGHTYDTRVLAQACPQDTPRTGVLSSVTRARL